MNPKATSTATKARFSPSTTWRRASRVTPSRVGASPAQFPQARVVDAEVVRHLVDDDPPDLVDHLLLAVGEGADGRAVDRDPVGHLPRIADAPHRQGEAL